MSEVRRLLTRNRELWTELGALNAQLRLLQANLPDAQGYRQALERRRREATEDLMRMESRIGLLADARERTVLRYYYAQGLSDAEIAEKMGLTDEWARKKRYAALRRLERAEAGESGEGPPAEKGGEKPDGRDGD
ncbi:MAG: sigma factor-like helix-turn-helix DNA-binding protein [Christensenellales bacterium]|uniref:RNA polymerase sigma-70 region 4 domain-containing protein n=1 Tax=Candidatus Avichristensenella intestinipullorum TaxID=2840693 RepID=A0A9D0YUU4_9FIRM|nr:sigma factor-like helix-turn-helix DNA-binding protein [Christensenellales bacterium]HIQ62393.1 hypothetical protein [Candidatus Avichristensenella intestinipullorum]